MSKTMGTEVFGSGQSCAAYIVCQTNIFCIWTVKMYIDHPKTHANKRKKTTGRWLTLVNHRHSLAAATSDP
jgi:hypothetical protein